MIQRRTLLKSGAAAALGAPALAGLAQQTVTLKFHTFMAPQSNVWLNMHKPWMDKVEKDSGGRIKFEAYPAMQLGGTPVQLYDQAKDGVVDIVWTLPGNTAGRFPRIEVFELPFMMNNAEATSKAYWEYVQTHGAGRVQGHAGHCAAGARPRHVPHQGQAGQDGGYRVHGQANLRMRARLNRPPEWHAMGTACHARCDRRGRRYIVRGTGSGAVSR